MSTISSVGFNKIQMQAFQALHIFVKNMFIEWPTGSGKTVYAEFALLRLQRKKERATEGGLHTAISEDGEYES